MKSRLLFSLLVLTGLMCLTSINKLIAQPFYTVDSIVIIPANPTHFDQVSIQIMGTASDSCSILDSFDRGIYGFDLDLTMDWDTSQTMLCDTNPVAYDISFQLGVLPAGTYTINLLGTNYADSTNQQLGFVVSGGSGACGSNSIIWVTSSDDDGLGTLREAIECANSTPGGDQILFNIPGLGDHIITVGAMTGDSLPAITSANTYIDASSQPGHGVNQDYSPKVIINGANTPWAKPINGIEVQASNVTILGLEIRGFPYNGIYADGVSNLAVGTFEKGNFIYGHGALQDVYLGYPGSYEGSGIHLSNCIDAQIKGNSIGIIAANEYSGIYIEGGGDNHIIGGGSVDDGNIITNNPVGVSIEDASDFCLIKYNRFSCNAIAGINYIGTVNQSIQVPTIDLVAASMIQGTAPIDGDVDVYLNNNTACTAAPCQGDTYLGTAVAAGGTWILAAPFAHGDTIQSGQQVVAQLIDDVNNSSEFSLCGIGSGLSACTDSIGQIWVSNTNENGPGSLDAAMICADTTIGSNIIRFDIPGTGPHTIYVGATSGLSLQAITDEGTIIDGTSQPGYGAGGDFTPQIILDGGNATWTYPHEAFLVQAGFCRISAIQIVNFPNDAIKIDGVSNCVMTDNVIYNNGDAADEFPGAPGQGPFEGSGIVLANGSTDNYIFNNYIGTDYTESVVGANEYCGILIGVDCDRNYIGDLEKGNVIANNLEGIRLMDLSTSVRISQNSIYCNSDEAIVLEGQANEATPAPDFALANFTSTTFLSGFIDEYISPLPTPLLGASVELFLNDDSACAGAPCQGKIYLGSSSLVGGGWQLTAPFANNVVLNDGDLVTTVFIDAEGNTSEFSECYIVANCMLTATPVVINETCGNDNGSITLITTGGPAPYSYDMGTGAQTSNVFSNLSEGTYTVTITDAYNCTAAFSTTLTDSPLPVVSTNNIENEICGMQNGSFIATATDGTAPYFYTIGGISGPNFFGLESGQYTVTVSDLYGCSDTETVNIGLTPGPDLQVSEVIDETCSSGDGGVILMTPTGTPNFTYNIGFNNQSSPIFQGVESGNYVATVTDNNGCSDTVPFTITNSPAPTEANTINVEDANCGNPDGSFTVTVTGGTGPYEYDAGNGEQPSSTITGLEAGSYVVTVTDANFCTITTAVTLADIPGPDLQINGVQDANCGQANGSITVAGSGGTPPYVYNLGMGNQSNNTFNALVAGTYFVTVTDGNQCTFEQTATINDIGGPSVSISNQIDETCGMSNGSVTILASGGTNPYVYDIGNGGTSSPTFNGLAAGSYNITVTDFTNCDAIINVVLVNTGAEPISGFTYTEDEGTVTLTNSSSANSTSFQWSFGDTNTSTDVNPVHVYATSGTYNLCLQANNACGFDVFCESVTVVPSIVTISGIIEKENGIPVTTVEMNCTGQSSIMNNGDGTYAFDMIAVGGDYEVTGLKDTLYGNGVSTFDVFNIQKHVLNVDTLESPYQIIAADVDNGGFVSTFDTYRMQQVILAIVDTFPNNTSWRFVAKDYVFMDPLHPLSENFWESLTYTNILEDTINQDLIAIKVGDVTLNASPVFTPESNNNFELLLNDEYLVDDELVELSFIPREGKLLAAMQFDIDFDTEVLEFVGVESADVEGLDAGDFGDRFVAEGRLKFAWYDVTGLGQQIDESTTLFKLVFKAKQDGARLSDHLNIIPFKAENRVFEPNGFTSNVLSVFEMTTATNGHTKAGYGLTCQPNPFTGFTSIQVRVPDQEGGSIKVYDISGKLAFQKEMHFDRGVNTIKIEANDLPSKGLYYVQVATEGYTQTTKLVLQ